MSNVTTQSIHSLKYYVEIDPEINHPFQDTDFSRIQKCMCTKGCTQHLTFEEPKIHTATGPISEKADSHYS